MNFQGGINISKAKIFLFACLVFIAGTGLASFLPEKLLFYKIWWFTAAIFFLVLAVWFWQNNERAEVAPALTERAGVKPAPTILLMAIFFFAVWRYGLSLPANTPDKIWHYNGHKVTVRGYVANEPDVRETNQKLEIAVEAINIYDSGEGKPSPYPISGEGKPGPYLNVTGKILVTTDLYPEYKYGDELELACDLKPPEEYKGFAYDRYLARYEIYSVCYYPKVTLTTPSLISPLLSPPARLAGAPAKRAGEAGGRNSGGGGELKGRGWVREFYSKIFSFKAKLAGLIDTGMSEPESSLARPIVFGGARGLEQTIRDNFQKTGLTHIMAVSGFNVSILAVIVMAVLLALGISRRYSFYIAVMILAAYIVMVGLPASAMRAGLMGFLVLWALKLGRLNKMTNSLVLTAAVLLLINPKLLRDDVGFQLSFLAIAGLVYAYPILEAVWQKIKLPKLKGLSDGLLITLAAQVFTLPILAYNFSQISLIAPLANLAVLWTLPVLTIFILIALPLSWAVPGLSFIFFLPSLILTEYILIVVKYLAGLPFSYVAVDYLWWGWAVVYYAAAIFVVIKLRNSELLKQEIDGKI